MRAMGRSRLCRVGIHRYAWVGRPAAPESYRACRRCGKARLIAGPDGFRSFYRSGMDKKSQVSDGFNDPPAPGG
jgi:hypothetical protein